MVLLVEHIAARDGLSPIMLLLRALWESPSRVNIAARPNWLRERYWSWLRKSNLDRPNGEMCAELSKHALRQAQGAYKGSGHMTGSGRMW